MPSSSEIQKSALLKFLLSWTLELLAGWGSEDKSETAHSIAQYNSQIHIFAAEQERSSLLC